MAIGHVTGQYQIASRSSNSMFELSSMTSATVSLESSFAILDLTFFLFRREESSRSTGATVAVSESMSVTAAVTFRDFRFAFGFVLAFAGIKDDTGAVAGHRTQSSPVPGECTTLVLQRHCGGGEIRTPVGGLQSHCLTAWLHPRCRS